MLTTASQESASEANVGVERPTEYALNVTIIPAMPVSNNGPAGPMRSMSHIDTMVIKTFDGADSSW